MLTSSPLLKITSNIVIPLRTDWFVGDRPLIQPSSPASGLNITAVISVAATLPTMIAKTGWSRNNLFIASTSSAGGLGAPHDRDALRGRQIEDHLRRREAEDHAGGVAFDDQNAAPESYAAG